MVLAGAPPGPSLTSFAPVPRGPWRDHQILLCTLLIPPTYPFFLRPHFGRSEEKEYDNLPPLDESVAAHLCLSMAIGWKAKTIHPSKPCRTTYYIPKVLSTPLRAQVITLSALPPSEQDQELYLLCSVRALRIYIGCSAHFRQSELLFVCFGGHTKGSPVTKQRLSG